MSNDPLLDQKTTSVRTLVAAILFTVMATLSIGGAWHIITVNGAISDVQNKQRDKQLVEMERQILEVRTQLARIETRLVRLTQIETRVVALENIHKGKGG